MGLFSCNSGNESPGGNKPLRPRNGDFSIKSGVVKYELRNKLQTEFMKITEPNQVMCIAFLPTEATF